MSYPLGTSLSFFWKPLFHWLFSLWKLASDWRAILQHNVLLFGILSSEVKEDEWMKSNHRYVSWGCVNGHIAKHSINKIMSNIVIFKYPVMQSSISCSYLSRYLKQPYNNSQKWLFLILVIVIINYGNKSIKLPKLKRQMHITCGYLL